MALTNKQIAREIDVLAKLLKKLVVHPERPDIAGEISLSHHLDGPSFLILTKDGLVKRTFSFNRQADAGSEAAPKRRTPKDEPVTDYKECAALFRLGLSAKELKELIDQLSE